MRDARAETADIVYTQKVARLTSAACQYSFPGMFTIIGGDGKEYGPVTADQIRAWITAGRANLDTMAKTPGSEEWRRLGDFPEFGGSAGGPPVLDPGVVPAGASATAAPVVGGPVAASGGLVLAERGPRLLARLIDWVIEFLCAIPGTALLGAELFKIVIAVSQGHEPDFSELDTHKLLLGGLVLGGAWLLLLVIQVWLLTTRGQSIGKIIVGLRIVRFADNSAPGIIYAWLLREAAITAIGFVLGIIPFIGPLMLRPVFHLVDWCMIFRDDRRCLHDLMAGTKVVKVVK